MMNNQFFNTILYSVLAGSATVGGIYLVLKWEDWARRNMIYLISFAAGALLATAFLDLLPESLTLTTHSQTLMYTLLTFIFFYTLEQRVIIHSHVEEECEEHLTTKKSVGWMGFIGLGFHSLIDGLIIGAGFEAGPSLGLLTTLAVIFHDVPEGTSIFSILLHTGFKKPQALRYSWLIALAKPVGAISAYLFLGQVDGSLLGSLLAVAAGSFIYIAASDLIPETHRKTNHLNAVFVLAGVLFLLAINRLFLG